MTPKEYYKLACQLVRMRDYIQYLKDVFHYPIGFDCPCRDSDVDYCEACEEEGNYRAYASKALRELLDYYSTYEPIAEDYLAAAYQTRRSKFSIWYPLKNSEWQLGRFLITAYALKHYGLSRLYQEAKSTGNFKYFNSEKQRCLTLYLPKIRDDLALGYEDFDRKYNASKAS